MEAVVVKNAGSHFLLSPLPGWRPFAAVLRGKVRLEKSGSTNPVAVGDRVRFETEDGYDIINGPLPDETHPAVITEILPRSNYVIRKSTNLSRQSHVIAANLDRALIAVSLYFPEIKLPFLDRLLVTCEVYRIPVVIALNKVDLYRSEDPEAVEAFRRIYEGAGYRVIETSARTGEGIPELRALCGSGLTLVSGESGVGKSSLIKALDPSLDPKTGKISEAHLQGRHTTSLYEMYPLEGGGFIIDTPGLRGFGLVDLEAEEIYRYFPEMLERADDCRFVPCTHTHEPGCAIKAAVEAGEISAERYNSYLGMLEEDKKFR
ncbi:MAG: ribosome small subunit-dependent GTPase A [Bacteroidales bacterium]|nr:ribosome small subunit-dependent GTPase A [Bacteroidales bacterium]